ncbi:MAG: hypothetical protein LBL21_02135, partial [Rickettsiales bacterium]|nr:hypothetical protein [Rickettsiales bacterium]
MAKKKATEDYRLHVHMNPKFGELAHALKYLNPDAEIVSGEPHSCSHIFSSVDPRRLVCPDGFYYNDKSDVITNKYKTYTGEY